MNAGRAQRVLVTGATGALGSQVVPALIRRGHPVRAMSRRPGPPGGSGAEWTVADLATGTGLPEALAGVSTVVHAAKDFSGLSTARSADAEYLSRLLPAAAAAGVGHVLYVSIVGVDRNPYPFYRVKVECERLLAGSGVPYSVVRASQFPQLVAGVLRRGLRGPLLFVPAGFAAEPVATEDLAEHLADLVGSGPSGTITEFAGPQRLRARDLAADWLRATGRRALVVPVWLRGPVARAFRMKSNIAGPGAPRGTTTWREYLSQHAGL